MARRPRPSPLLAPGRRQGHPDLVSQDLLLQLERLYAEQQLPAVEGNPCQSCFACCTATGHLTHRISALELAYVGWKVGPWAAESLASYAARERNEEGRLVFEHCPHYQNGCGIYDHRPFSCRVFGHFRERGTELPGGCSFQGRETEFARQDYYQVVPGARALRPLLREFSLLARPRHAQAAGPGQEASLDWLDQDDPVDRALGHLAGGHYDQALSELLAQLERQPEGSGFVWHTLGLVYGLLDRPALAVEAFGRAVTLMPDQADCLAQLGTSLMLTTAPGMLGYGHLLLEEWNQAAAQLARALEIEPENGFYALRLASARLALGQRQQAIPLLELAAGFEPTRHLALAQLQSCAKSEPTGPCA
ncbi:hypothetical protein DYH09_17120 [bacterium CPR1]|nr:hypothetical protein [bacterium CPR1]